MHITKVELENIKSHAHEIFSFERGTTAITGANGAGKTTIIEAVAWALFDLLDYKKDDFAKRGSKGKGVVRVIFESSLDERNYLVYRDTGNGYYIYDPELKAKIADKKEEVTRFLRQHLGVEAGTDLETLFRRAIGVPQGTFTAIFLESPTERKKAFDKLLKVEEYRQGAEKLRETASFLKTKIVSVREKIARAEGELSRLETIETDYKNLAEQIENLSANLKNLEKEIFGKKEIVKKFDEAEVFINQLKSKHDQIQSKKTTAEIIAKQKEAEKNQAQIAAEKIKTVEAGYQTYIAALARLKELERERAERDKLNAEKTTIETAQINVKADQKRFAEDLEKANKSNLEIENLKPKVAEQERLEKQRETLRDELAKANAVENQIEKLENKMADLRKKYKANQDQIKEVEAKTGSAENFETLQKRDVELTQSLAGLRAKLNADEKFQSEIKNGLCPILSEKCLNLKPGQTLENFVSTQFTEVKSKISALESEQKTLAVNLKTSREAEKFSVQLETLKSREKEIGDEGKGYKAESEELNNRLKNQPKLKDDLAKIEAEIKSLDNPKAKLLNAESEALRIPNIREKITEVEKNLERLESERLIFTDQLEVYKNLDADWKKTSDERDQTAKAHSEFLSHETIAKLLPEREKEFVKATQEFENLQKEFAKIAAEFETASKDYNREQHLSEKAELLSAEKSLAETRARFEETERRSRELENELKRLQEIRAAMQNEFAEKDKLERVAETTDFIRETLKEAAPRVARNYVHYVSLEAAQMYREITGNAERTLKWTEDYGIVLEEGGHERPFVNLSGGEQMAAALSVRLALLKQLSDIRVAFFDEPTTNMDAERRENLATQIGNIKHFDQLFVISHDDTFEGYVDNVVSVRGTINE